MKILIKNGTVIIDGCRRIENGAVLVDDQKLWEYIKIIKILIVIEQLMSKIIILCQASLRPIHMVI